MLPLLGRYVFQGGLWKWDILPSAPFTTGECQPAV
jgi:hypothetical protein